MFWRGSKLYRQNDFRCMKCRSIEDEWTTNNFTFNTKCNSPIQTTTYFDDIICQNLYTTSIMLQIMFIKNNIFWRTFSRVLRKVSSTCRSCKTIVHCLNRRQHRRKIQEKFECTKTMIYI